MQNVDRVKKFSGGNWECLSDGELGNTLFQAATGVGKGDSGTILITGTTLPLEYISTEYCEAPYSPSPNCTQLVTYAYMSII